MASTHLHQPSEANLWRVHAPAPSLEYKRYKLPDVMLGCEWVFSTYLHSSYHNLLRLRHQINHNEEVTTQHTSLIEIKLEAS